MNRLQRIYAINLLIDHAYTTNRTKIRDLCELLNIDTSDMFYDEMGQAAFDMLTENIKEEPIREKA
jgi:hypothetical protein